jgi:hypothetical protein
MHGEFVGLGLVSQGKPAAYMCLRQNIVPQMVGTQV